MLLSSVTLVIYATIRVSAGWRRQLLPVAVGPWWLERYPYYSYTVEDLLCGSSISKITASGIWDAEKWEIVKALLVSCLNHSRNWFFNARHAKIESVSGKAWWHLVTFVLISDTCVHVNPENARKRAMLLETERCFHNLPNKSCCSRWGQRPRRAWS